MSWLWFGILTGAIIAVTLTGAIIAVTWTLREHRKMLAHLAQHIQLIERALVGGEK